jgi:hypothetical protein
VKSAAPRSSMSGLVTELSSSLRDDILILSSIVLRLRIILIGLTVTVRHIILRRRRKPESRRQASNLVGRIV